MTTILFAIGLAVVLTNIFIASMTLGSKLQKKYSNRKSMFQICENFWSWFWDKIF